MPYPGRCRERGMSSVTTRLSGGYLLTCTPLLIAVTCFAQLPPGASEERLPRDARELQLAPGEREAPLPEAYIEKDGRANPENILVADAVWALVFVQTKITEDSGLPANAMYSLKRQFGLDDATAAGLLRHVQTSFEANRRADLAGRDRFCDAGVVTNEDYVREKERATKASEDVRVLAVAELEEVVGPEAYARILSAGNVQRSSMSKVEVDLRLLVANESAADIATRVELICKPRSK
jgi:hypothetical protein